MLLQPRRDEQVPPNLRPNSSTKPPWYPHLTHPIHPTPHFSWNWLNLLQVGSLLATAAAAYTYFQPLLCCGCHISSEAAPPRWQRQPGVLKRLPRGFSLSAAPHLNSQQQASEPLAPQVGKSLPRGEIALRKIEKMGKCHTRQAS